MLSMLIAAGLVVPGGEPTDPGDVGEFVRALWLVQRVGTDRSADPAADEATKGSLAKLLASGVGWDSTGGQSLMDSTTHRRLAGADGRLDADEVRRALEAADPGLRRSLHPILRGHLDTLTTSFDRIGAEHLGPVRELGDWIAGRLESTGRAEVIVVCTGNSRRSFFGALMGNAAASYYGLPEVRFHCGGTEPSALNPRTIRALAEVGFLVGPTGSEAPRGPTGVENPIYRVSWGTDPEVTEALEFSKLYTDPANPADGFAALMVCGEADEACPTVRGASARISMPFLDPKIYDGSAYEGAKYAERRDDLGREMLAALLRARRRLDATAGESR